MREECQVCGHKLKADVCKKCGADAMEQVVAGFHGHDRVSMFKQGLVNIILTDRRLLVFDDIAAVVSAGIMGGMGGALGAAASVAASKAMASKPRNGSKDLDIPLHNIKGLRQQVATKFGATGLHLLVDLPDGKTHDLWLKDSFTHPAMQPDYFIALVADRSGRPVMTQP